MTMKLSISILVAGILAEAAMVLFLIVTGGVALTPLDEHQENHPETYGLLDVETQATIDAAKHQLTAVAQGTPLPTTAGRATEAPTVAPVPVGQSVLANGVRYTVNAINDPEPDGFFKPSAGKRFVAVDITVESVDKPTLFGISFIDLRAADGKDYGWTNGNNKPVLETGTLQPGQTARGWVTIAVPSDASLTAVIAAVPTTQKVQIADLTR